MKTVIKALAILATLITQPAQAADTASPDMLASVFGGVEISCDTLAIFDHPGEPLDFEAPTQAKDFDVEECRRLLRPSAALELAAPLQSIWADEESATEALNSETAGQNAMKLATADQLQAQAVEDLHAMFAPAIKACQALSERQEHMSRVCYFGVPAADAGAPFMAAFEAMATNSLPDNEALCESSPLQRSDIAEPELAAAIPQGANSLNWTAMRKMLSRDGFQCSAFEGNGCARNILSIALPAVADAPQSAGQEGPLDGMILPRLLIYYQGKWMVRGPPQRSVTCIEAEFSQGECELPKPTRGKESGICIVGEDWHNWGMLLYLLNNMPE